MKLVMLVQDLHKPIPAAVTVHRNYGIESVRAIDGKIHRGEAMFLESSDAVFVNWLVQFDGVWLTNNPVTGQWKLHHVKVSA